MKKGPKVLLLDIETSPLITYSWGLHEQHLTVDQMKTDWSIISWAAKWLGSEKVMYADVRAQKNYRNDKHILKRIWKLLDKADIVITQNGIRFDQKKLNARFVINGYKPPSSYKSIDTYRLATKHFGFTSNKLVYMTEKLNTKYKKLKHSKFPGLELWQQCLKGNKEAWKEMEIYNKYDVLALEELYNKLIPWDSSINFNLYHSRPEHVCKCGSRDFMSKGYRYTSSGKFTRHICTKCGAEVRGRKNLFTADKKESLKLGT